MSLPKKNLLSICVLLLACGLAAGQCSPCTIWSPNSTPTIANSGDSTSVELGVKFRADSTGYVTGIRFYKSTANIGQHVGNLWSSSGALLATAQFSGESASGWQQVNFGNPVLISSGTTYIASYFAPFGNYAFDINFFASTGVDNPPLHALADGADGPDGVYNYGSSSSFPSSSYSSSNYWVDVVFVPQGSTTPPAVISTNPPNGSGAAPIVSSPTATFSEAMNPATINSGNFQLYDSNNNLVSGTVSYASATTSAIFHPNTSLAYQATYTAVVRGTVKDFLGNSLGNDVSWTFTTETKPNDTVCPCTIWPSSWAPSLVDGGDATSVEVGVKFVADLNGYVTGIRFEKAAANTGTHTGNIWTTTGTLLGSVVFTGESASGWQQASFATPIPVTAGTTYVASYFDPNGHYSWDEYALASSVDNSPLHALSSSSSAGNGIYTVSTKSTFPNTTYHASNYGVDVVYVLRNSTAAPVVQSTTPGNATSGAALGGPISAQFDEPMDAGTITSSAFQLVDSSNNVIPGTVTYIPASASLSFQPSLSLLPQTVYTATIRNSVHDTFGNALVSNYTWSFTTAPPPADSGPGGPILVIASTVNPFSRYLGEILLNEGLNEFRIKDITTVTPTVLSQYDIVILGDFALTSAQASMLNNWTTNGGSLIAMHPDQQLAGLLGLIPTGQTLSEGYLQVNTQSAPGSGIYGQTIQFHGTADLYTISGSSSVATLYSDSSTPTSYPAVTVANAGAGTAAAFTYDLSRSVVYLREGNPTWSGEDRDGYIDPAYGVTEIRSNDLYYGNASFDPETDWVNLNNVQVPQADEQQRLLANLIQFLNLNRKPLPRFWYLPNGYKAAVIMTGDDHGGNGTQPRFNTYISESPANCSVADWTCVRATSYLFPDNVTFTNNSYPTYIAEGFEIANHTDNDPTCSTYTPASLEASITASLGRMQNDFPSAPASRTNRTHCVLWSDYDSQPSILLKHGLRLDTSYYYWPDPWVQDRPGLFTGSGLPMRYADRNGNTIDVYQAPTQFPDETTWNMPNDINTVLANAVGPQGFYAVLTANMHTDHIQEDESDQIVAAAQSYGAPVIAAVQMLNWLDGRNNSTFSNMSWTSPVLTFTVTAATGAHNLEVMVPTTAPSGPLVNILLNNAHVNYLLQTIKGIQYATFLTTGGTYQAVYGTTYSISGNISGAGGNGATVTLSGSASATTTADSSGNFTFQGVANGSYTVTPSSACCTYTPTSQPATVNGASVTGVNFSTVAVTYSISGTISGPGGNGATVTLGGAASGTTTANASGNYSFTGLANGAYTVTPSSANFTYTPTAQSVTLNNANASANFATVTYSISGTIAGAGGNGATVALSGSATGSSTADGSGNYTFNGLANGAYTVTPSNTGSTFSPTSQGATINNANVTGLNFTSSPVTYSISGSITGAGGNGATVTLSGAATGSTTADSSGNFTISGLANGTYTITPTNPGYVFTPVNRSKTISGANVTAVNFSTTGAPAVQLSPTSLAFGNQQLNATSSPQPVTLTNSGTAPLSITAISFTGSNPTNFGQTNNCGTSLPAGNSCNINVTFTPNAKGARTAKLSISDNGPKSPQTVALSGTGVVLPTATLSTTSMAFGTVLDLTVSAAKSMTVKNNGTTALQFNSIAIVGSNPSDFIISSNNCGSSLAAAATCTVKVEFDPQAAGARSASLTFTDNAADSPQSVSLTGTGTMVQATPVSLSFAALAVGGQSAAKSVSIKNAGPGSLTISGPALTGNNPGDFSYTTTCGATLAANSTCSVAVRFAPTATGSRTASVSFGDSDPSSPQLVSLTGTGQ